MEPVLLTTSIVMDHVDQNKVTRCVVMCAFGVVNFAMALVWRDMWIVDHFVVVIPTILCVMVLV